MKGYKVFSFKRRQQEIDNILLSFTSYFSKNITCCMNNKSHMETKAPHYVLGVAENLL
jgi:hypothetical protein